MRSRMDRYNKDIKNDNQENYSRQIKNDELYHNIGNNAKYTNFTDVSNSNVVSLDDAKKKYRTREGYHTIKEYGNIEKSPKVKKELDQFNYLYQDRENRVYDINSVIAQAKENRKEKDELEEKRKLKNTNYNILANLNSEELEKYREEKNKNNKSKKPNEKELRGLIDTITSKTLAGEISKEASVDLLSDLMATSIDDKLESDKKLDLSKEILDKNSIEKIENEKIETTQNKELKDMDKSFYTKSMDLSDKDFDFEDLENKKVPLIIKIILIIFLLVILAIGVYFIYKYLK